MRPVNIAMLFFSLMIAGGSGAARALEVPSPDGRLALSFAVEDFEGSAACTVYGERNVVRDHYNQAIVALREQEIPHRRLQLTLRVYDAGAAFCYTLPRQPGMRRVVLAGERTEFRFPDDYTAWATYRAQGKYEKTPTSGIRPGKVIRETTLDPSVPTRTHVRIDRFLVDRDMPLTLAASDKHPGVAPTFAHPGILHTRADLERIRNNVAAGAEPWKSGFARLQADPASQADWKMRGPFAIVSRDARDNAHNAEFAADANAAYQNALMWAITGDAAHARKAVELLNAWSRTLQQITGHDKELAASLYGFKVVNAAEILRHWDDGWPAAEIRQFERVVRAVIYPRIANFATFANGNWDTGCIKTMMAIGVFLDDRAIFERAVNYFHNGSGNGCLTHYIINETGQCQESGRDQQHTQLGIAHLAEAAEIGWNQGIDLYGADDNRLLKGFEYTARYNLGEDVPFVPYTDTTGKYKWDVIATEGRGRLRPIFEMVWNHYTNRRGIAAPYTKRAADQLRPEGAAFQTDHPGFGTLLFTRDTEVSPPAPGAGTRRDTSAVEEKRIGPP